MQKILAIIPARSGSKSVPDKNIRMINKKPLLAYSIEHAQKSKYINRIILSTDSKKYQKIGLQYGAETPFLRPAEFATDSSLDIDVFYHALSFLKQKENYLPDLVVQLRPTYPIRNVEDIDKMIEIALNNSDIDSVRSITEAQEIPFKMWTMDNFGRINPICSEINECYNMPRQKLPKAYYQNACIDVVRGSIILEQKSMSGKNIYGYVMKNNLDIDTEEQFKLAEYYLLAQNGKLNFCFDIDGVIAITSDATDYSKSMPNKEIISFINELYNYGNFIRIHTARGYTTGINWSEITKKQLSSWWVKFHELNFGKPNADFYIDDHAMELTNLDKFRKILKR